MRPSILKNLNFKDLVETARDYIGDAKICKSLDVTIGNTLISDEADKKYIIGSNVEKLMIDIIINHMNDKDICHGAACTLINIMCLGCNTIYAYLTLLMEYCLLSIFKLNACVHSYIHCV